MKTQATDWEKILVNHISGKTTISRDTNSGIKNEKICAKI